MTRGIVYIVWGEYKKPFLKRSIESVKNFGYKYEVVHVKSKIKGLAKKSLMLNKSPFDVTCFLDTDTIVKAEIDYGFDMAEKHDLACCIAPASSAYLAEPNTLRDIMNKDLPQYNTGVLFFSKKAEPTFSRWIELAKEYPVSGANDQLTFSQAVYETINPYVLPRTWNYRASVSYETTPYFGELKILHSRYDI